LLFLLFGGFDHHYQPCHWHGDISFYHILSSEISPFPHDGVAAGIRPLVFLRDDDAIPLGEGGGEERAGEEGSKRAV